MGYPGEAAEKAAAGLARMSAWVDAWPANMARSVEARLWGRTAKLHEEGGEVVEAMIAYTSQNPRKNATANLSAVEKELLDVAAAALGAVEHIHANDGSSLDRLYRHVGRVTARMDQHEAERNGAG